MFEFRSIEPNYDDRNSNSKINSVRWEGVQIANHKNLHTAHPNAWSDDDPNALVIPGQFRFDETHIDPTVTTYQVTKYSERWNGSRNRNKNLYEYYRKSKCKENVTFETIVRRITTLRSTQF